MSKVKKQRTLEEIVNQDGEQRMIPMPTRGCVVGPGAPMSSGTVIRIKSKKHQAEILRAMAAEYEKGEQVMNKENMQKWLDALRSGKFKQGRSQLATGTHVGTDENGYGEYKYTYCCLGVAEVVRGLDIEDLLDQPLPDTHLASWLDVEPGVAWGEEWNPYIAIPQMSVREANEFLGDEDGEPLNREAFESLANGSGLSCAIANDECNLSFEQIADLIEQYGLVEH